MQDRDAEPLKNVLTYKKWCQPSSVLQYRLMDFADNCCCTFLDNLQSLIPYEALRAT
jgi:hypothetical protein